MTSAEKGQRGGAAQEREGAHLPTLENYLFTEKRADGENCSKIQGRHSDKERGAKLFLTARVIS